MAVRMVFESFGVPLEHFIVGVKDTPRGSFEGLIKKLGAFTKALERNGTRQVFRVVLIIVSEDLLKDLQDKLETATTSIIHRCSWKG